MTEITKQIPFNALPTSAISTIYALSALAVISAISATSLMQLKYFSNITLFQQKKIFKLLILLFF
jgi:hypothetical protein